MNFDDLSVSEQLRSLVNKGRVRVYTDNRAYEVDIISVSESVWLYDADQDKDFFVPMTSIVRVGG